MGVGGAAIRQLDWSPHPGQGQATILSLLDYCRDPQIIPPLGTPAWAPGWSALPSHESSPLPPALAPPAP